MKLKTWTAFMAVAALGTGVLAQQEQPTPRSSPAKAQDATVTKPFCLTKLDTLVGLEVKGPKGDKVAKIEDLCLNPGDGSIESVVLSSGGVAGIGDKKRLIGWRELQLTQTMKGDQMQYTASVSLTEDQLKALREFDKKVAPAPGSSAPADRGTAIQSIRTCSSDLKGHKVVNDAKEDLGELDEVVLDTNAGRVAYVVLGAGGTLGLGEKHYALPWRALHLERDAEGDLIVRSNLTKEKLKSAPEFERDAWDRMCDPAWMQRVYGHYSADPYWTGTRSASSEPKDKSKTDG